LGLFRVSKNSLLQKILGTQELTKSDASSKFWNIVREKQLKKNGRTYECDQELKEAFKIETLTIGSVQHLLKQNMEPVLDDKGKQKKVTIAVEKRAGKKIYAVSDALASIIGTNDVERKSVLGKIWAYVKANKLQDPEDKMYIKCDDKISQLFNGATRVNSNQFLKMVGSHLTEKEVQDEVVVYTGVSTPSKRGGVSSSAERAARTRTVKPTKHAILIVDGTAYTVPYSAGPELFKMLNIKPGKSSLKFQTSGDVASAPIDVKVAPKESTGGIASFEE